MQIGCRCWGRRSRHCGRRPSLRESLLDCGHHPTLLTKMPVLDHTRSDCSHGDRDVSPRTLDCSRHRIRDCGCNPRLCCCDCCPCRCEPRHRIRDCGSRSNMLPQPARTGCRSGCRRDPCYLYSPSPTHLRPAAAKRLRAMNNRRRSRMACCQELKRLVSKSDDQERGHCHK